MKSIQYFNTRIYFLTNYAIYIANHDIHEAVFSDNKMKINLTFKDIARPTYFDVGLFDI